MSAEAGGSGRAPSVLDPRWLVGAVQGQQTKPINGCDGQTARDQVQTGVAEGQRGHGPESGLGCLVCVLQSSRGRQQQEAPAAPAL